MKFNNDSLREAVNEWVNGQQKAEGKYGHISTWDTSDVTDMSNLFNFTNAQRFNENISS